MDGRGGGGGGGGGGAPPTLASTLTTAPRPAAVSCPPRVGSPPAEKQRCSAAISMASRITSLDAGGRVLGTVHGRRLK